MKEETEYEIARRVCIEFIRTRDEFWLRELLDEIKRQGGIMRVSQGVTISDYLKSAFLETGVISWNYTDTGVFIKVLHENNLAMMKFHVRKSEEIEAKIRVLSAEKARVDRSIEELIVEHMNDGPEEKLFQFMHVCKSIYKNEIELIQEYKYRNAGINWESFMGHETMKCPQLIDVLEQAFKELFKCPKYSVTHRPIYKYDKVNDRVIGYTGDTWSSKMKQESIELLQNVVSVQCGNEVKTQDNDVKNDIINKECYNYCSSIRVAEGQHLTHVDIIAAVNRMYIQKKKVHLYSAKLTNGEGNNFVITISAGSIV